LTRFVPMTASLHAFSVQVDRRQRFHPAGL
jgi:hypothetical protein